MDHILDMRRLIPCSWPIVAAVLAACSSSSSAPLGQAPPGDDGGAPADDASIDAGPDASLDDPRIPAKYQPFAAAFENERKALGAPGAAVAILEGGQLTFFHGFGTKGPNSTAPVRARTLFRIGSMTKALTTAAFLSLVQEGKLDPEALLTSVVPDVALPAGADLSTLTFADLLTHQSGLADYLVLDSSHDDAALAQFLTGTTFQSNEYFMDPPGTFWNYSNPNFYLAGLAIERAGGVPYPQAVEQRVLAPLGMTRTFFHPSDVLADGDYADGKSTDANGQPWDVKPDSYDNAWARPAGYAFSSVLDYARFVQFLYAGNQAVLSDAERKDMEAPKVPTLEIGTLDEYAYALWSDPGFRLGNAYYEDPIVFHGGDIAGFAADFYLVPASGFGIVMFADADGAHFETSLALALRSFAQLPAPGPLPSAFTVDPSTFPSFAGTYFDPNGVVGHVVVTVGTGKQVQVSMPDLDAAGIQYDKTMTPITPDNFEMTIQGVPVGITFIADATGAFTWLRAREFVAKRSGPGMRQPVVHVDARRLRARLLQRL